VPLRETTSGELFPDHSVQTTCLKLGNEPSTRWLILLHTLSYPHDARQGALNAEAISSFNTNYFYHKEPVRVSLVAMVTRRDMKEDVWAKSATSN
jgi:hypothetical protein